MKTFVCLLLTVTALLLAAHFLTPSRVESQDTPSQRTKKAFGVTAAKVADTAIDSPAIVSTLPTVATLRAALLGTNQAEMKIAFQQLANYLAQNPEKLSEALAGLKSDRNYPQLFSWLSEWNADEPTPAGQNLIRTWISDLAQNDHSREGQQAAFGLLGHATPDAEFLPVISQLYRDAANNQMQVSAIVTLKDWAARNPNLQSAIQEHLVEIVNSTSDEEARERAFEVVATVGLPDATLIDAADLLWKEPSDANRSLLAQAFEKAGNSAREFALARLEQACNETSDLNAKRSALAQIARLGKRTSIDALRRLGASHPELQADVNDYWRILQEGASDIATIDRMKLESEAQLAALAESSHP